MTKRILAVILSLCVIFSFAVIANAAVSVDEDIIITLTICPGTALTDDVIEAPDCSGYFSKGWEIKMAGSEEWIPYVDGTPLDEEYNGATIRYYAATIAGEYKNSNECVLTVKHNPEGPYKWDGSNHWRECVDCGEICEKAYHSFFETPDNNNVTVCSVCGAEKTAQWRGLAAFWTWLMNLLITLIG